jgi:predicted TIM-barrel enzyme
MCRTVGPDQQNIIHAGPVDRQSFDVSRAQSKNGHLGQKKINLVASETSIIEVGDRKFWIIFRHRLLKNLYHLVILH